MKLAEALATLAALAAMGALLFAPQIGAGRVAAIALAATAVVLAATLHVTGPFRWQMLPAEAMILAVVVMLSLGAQPDGVGRNVAAVLSLAVAGLSAILATGFPLAELPAPSGPYAAGSITVELTRPESASGIEDRRLIAKVWYPAEDASGRPESLWSEARAPGMPPPLRFLLGYLSGVETHTRTGASIRTDSAPYPVLIYNHALVSTPSENTLLMESLASEGFIVVSVSHVGQAAEHTALQAAVPPEERSRDKALYAEWTAATDRSERGRIMADIYANSSGMAELVRRRTADTAFVLDRIATVLAAIPGANEGAAGSADGVAVADLRRVGALGFSLGGAVATRWCMTDQRCRAAVNLDGGAFAAPEDTALRVPYLMIYAAATEGANDALKARATELEEETLAGARHMDFTDATLLFPLLKRLGALGPASGAEIVRRKNERVMEFFEARLR